MGIELLFSNYLLMVDELKEPVYTEEILLTEDKEELEILKIKHIKKLKLHLWRTVAGINDLMKREIEKIN